MASKNSLLLIRKPTTLFFITVISYFIFMFTLQPSWMLSGEMWAEMATNYFHHSISANLLEQLFTTDAGYIPLPQRLIAFLGSIFNLPLATIPYYYTYSATIVSGAMAGVFCFREFRNVFQNDLYRFFVAMASLLVIDFETRTFINFSYLIVLSGSFILASSLATSDVSQSNANKNWFFLLPIFVMSKPYALLVLPAMCLIALFNNKNRKFLQLTVATAAMATIQIIQLLISQKLGVMSNLSNNFTVYEKLLATLKYSFGFFAGYLMGPRLFHRFYGWTLDTRVLSPSNLFVIIGLSFVIAILYATKFRFKTYPLTYIGLSIIGGNFFLNCFALSDQWNISMERLNGLPVYRHVIPCFFSCLLIAAELIERQTHIKKKTLIFTLWFGLSGWFSFGLGLSKEPGLIVLGNSQWQKNAIPIDTFKGEVGPVCVPINPLGWIYGINCSLLNTDVNWGQSFTFKDKGSKELTQNLIKYNIRWPEDLNTKKLFSFAVLVKLAPESSPRNETKQIEFKAKAILELVTGERVQWGTVQKLMASGGLLQFSNFKEGYLFSEIKSIELQTEHPLQIAELSRNESQTNSTAAILWMGQ